MVARWVRVPTKMSHLSVSPRVVGLDSLRRVWKSLKTNPVWELLPLVVPAIPRVPPRITTLLINKLEVVELGRKLIWCLWVVLARMSLLGSSLSLRASRRTSRPPVPVWWMSSGKLADSLLRPRAAHGTSNWIKMIDHRAQATSMIPKTVPATPICPTKRWSVSSKSQKISTSSFRSIIERSQRP